MAWLGASLALLAIPLLFLRQPLHALLRRLLAFAPSLDKPADPAPRSAPTAFENRKAHEHRPPAVLAPNRLPPETTSATAAANTESTAGDAQPVAAPAPAITVAPGTEAHADGVDAGGQDASNYSSDAETVTDVAKLMPPPPAPSPQPQSSAQAKRLPKPPSSSLRPPPSSASSLLPNRAPPSNLSPNSHAKTQRVSQKVVLSPGHSPLDWAALTKSGQNLSGVQRVQKVTPSQLAKQNGRKGKPAWAAWKGRVYNITPYLPFHPGGEGQLMRAAGKSEVAEKLFNETHPWVNWENMLGECLVGVLVAEGQGEGQDEASTMEDMD